MSGFGSNNPQHGGNWETIIDVDDGNNLEENREMYPVIQDDDGNESDYSLDYEFPGPRYANYRHNIQEDDSLSDLSDAEVDLSAQRFDMWDDDPYNDFTWESNDMQLTKFIKQKQKQLRAVQKDDDFSFWRKEKGWPKQLPFSCSTTNHDQSANAICLVQSNCGLSEKLFAVYRDRIIECGKSPRKNDKPVKQNTARDTTWIESSEPFQQLTGAQSLVDEEKYIDTHQSISLSKIQSGLTLNDQLHTETEHEDFIHKFEPFTKYIKRGDYPGTLPEDAYLALGFDPQCLVQKFGYMAIGGVEGEFELYCCMDLDHPVKIWGTKFKGKDNVMLMTNAIQLVRWKNNITGVYQHMLIGCMNEAGLLFYHLPAHGQCEDIRARRQKQQSAVRLHSHLRSFNGVPINDAKLSPDGTKLVCVGDDSIIFLIEVSHCETTGEVTFGAPIDVVIPKLIFQQNNIPYSSQYVAWSPSSHYFAHTSDSHNLVLVWRVSTREIIYSIDAAGYTYAIAFHPHLDNILVFSNRYGYFHTVDLSKGTTTGSNECINILTFDHSSRYHQCLDTCIQHDSNQAVFHTQHLRIRHEITMTSFRGEYNTRLRILAKINGIEWSKDGRYLYVATKKRVLAFQFFRKAKVPTLIDITGIHVRKLLEIQEASKSRKRKKLNKNETTTFSSTLQHWSIIIPDSIQYRVLGDAQQLACHW